MGLLINENEFTSKSTSPKLIGETFTTLRTGTIEGAVEQDGSQYNVSDFPDIKVLLENNELPYMPINRFDAMVAEQGGCDSFGYGTDTLWTQWSTRPANDLVYTKTASYEVGDPVYDVPGGNIIGNITETGQSYPMTYTDTNGVAYNTRFVTHVSGPVDSTPYFKVPKKLGRVLVRSQKPTADNNYTWYNVYSDGFVEQGGKFATMDTTSLTISLPIEMSSNVYSIIGTGNEYSNTSGHFAPKSATTTSFTAGVGTNGGNGGWWEVSGYASSAEYTKDKWDYQNVNYERHMIQLK